MAEVELGDKVRDTISGFEGIATGVFNYLNGCTRVGISGSMSDPDKEPPTWVFDEPQVEVVESGAHFAAPVPGGGGPRSARPPK